MYMPVPVVSLFEVWVCDRFLTRMAGLNPAGGVDIFLL